MKRTIMILSAIMLTLFGGTTFAQSSKTNDYNLQKAYDVLREDGDEAKAMELINAQLKATPDNVEALLLRVNLNRRNKEYGTALSDLNRALKVNKPKKSEIANSTLHWWKASIYYDMGEESAAIEEFSTAYTLAQKDNKENLQDLSFSYGQALFTAGRIAEADVIYRRMLAEDETDQAAMIGLARNMITREEYQAAIDMLEKCRKLDAGYSEIYRFQMQAYTKLGELTKAIDAGITWYDKDDDANASAIIDVMKQKPVYAEASVANKMKKSDEPAKWKMFMTSYYEDLHEYTKAVKLYDEIEQEFGHSARINFYRSDCYSELGLMQRAIEDVSVIVDKDPDFFSLSARGDYYRLNGQYEEAIKDFTAAAEEDPKVSYSYYKRGWCYEILGDKTKAMEDYNMGIELNEDYPYLYLMRGELLLFDGKTAEANKDFEQILQRDTIAQDGSCRQYSLHFLGRDTEAVEWMDKIIASDPEDHGHYYDQACLYSRMGRLQDAVAALKTSFEKGYRSFAHIEHDDDLDAIRELPEFKALMEEYQAKHAEYLKQYDLEMPVREAQITEIAIKRNTGGTFEIPCDINGLSLQMIFDTGASDVTISSVEANFMLKNGYLSDKDIKGKKYYMTASGDINPGTVITLREVKVGDAVLKNVDASVVKSQRAPLLLGQSAMERFGTITIDNINNRLIIKH